MSGYPRRGVVSAFELLQVLCNLVGVRQFALNFFSTLFLDACLVVQVNVKDLFSYLMIVKPGAFWLRMEKQIEKKFSASKSKTK
jgi:hypothetical protein